MKRILLAAALLAVLPGWGSAASNDFVSIRPEPTYYARWLRADFHPFATQVRGIPVKQLRASWCKANEFRKELFPPDLAADFEHTGGLAFSVDGSFDSSKVPQTALIGVYETCSGQRGSFLLILARPPGKPATIRFVHEFRELQFGILAMRSAATINVFHCMECDHLDRFEWSKTKKQFVRLKPADEGSR